MSPTTALEPGFPTRRALIGVGVALLAGGAGPLRKPAVQRRAAPPLPLVMLDPGHGGRDPGAIGVSGTHEKQVAFAAAQEVRRQLLALRRYRVELTRSRDVFIPLAERVGIAQRRGAALFMSIHADSVSDHGVRGASVYTLSDTASDPQAAALARRENRADRYGGPQFRDQPPAVARILSSLVRQETRAGSARLSRSMVGALGGGVKLLPNPARHASFAVLRAADVPSVLVEMGFMSNRDDEAALRRADHRVRIAGCMSRAVQGWFAAHPGGSGPQRGNLAVTGPVG